MENLSLLSCPKLSKLMVLSYFKCLPLACVRFEPGQFISIMHLLLYTVHSLIMSSLSVLVKIPGDWKDKEKRASHL